ncbi:MAG: transcriptional regulator [Halobaculum sp.]|jgi:hypothetical protein
MADNRDEDGKFREQYPDSDFVSAVEDATVASTQTVAEAVGCSYDLAYRRLQALEEEEKIGCESVGGSFVWTGVTRQD